MGRFLKRSHVEIRIESTGENKKYHGTSCKRIKADAVFACGFACGSWKLSSSAPSLIMTTKR